MYGPGHTLQHLLLLEIKMHACGGNKLVVTNVLLPPTLLHPEIMCHIEIYFLYSCTTTIKFKVYWGIVTLGMPYIKHHHNFEML